MPVWVFAAVTVTPGMRAPLASATVPPSVALLVCVNAEIETSKDSNIPATTTFFMDHPPCCKRPESRFLLVLRCGYCTKDGARTQAAEDCARQNQLGGRSSPLHRTTIQIESSVRFGSGTGRPLSSISLRMSDAVSDRKS